jgi:hypothetical protein
VASKNKLFELFPWAGGVNNSLDPATIPANQLTEAEHVVLGTRPSRKKREGITFNWDDNTSNAAFVIGLKDAWFDDVATDSKFKRLVSVMNDKTIYWYNTSGNATLLTDTGTAWPEDITIASFEMMNNFLGIAVDGMGNLPKKWDGTGDVEDLGGTPPDFAFMRSHLGRLWTNDKNNKDRLHYCTTGNPEEWNGVGDSGALDIGIGDGDPVGITAIFPTYKGDLFVAKKTKLYRVTGFTPETFSVHLVSNGIGCISHNSIAQVDQDDMVFASERGFHSLVATANFGDFEGAFLSADIQNTFNNDFVKARLKYVKGSYLSQINSVAFTITDDSISSNYNNTIWLYNFVQKAWYSWPNIPCESIGYSTDDDKNRWFLGGITGRVAKTFNDLNYDISEAGANTAIPFRIKTGIIYVDDQRYLIKGFKKFSLIFNPVGIFTLTVTIKIDNFSNQSFAFTSDIAFIFLLGVNFVLGTSTLGGGALALAPYTIGIDGYGRGIQVTIEQSGIDQEVEIQGMAIEYHPAGPQQETRLGDNA